MTELSRILIVLGMLLFAGCIQIAQRRARAKRRHANVIERVLHG